MTSRFTTALVFCLFSMLLLPAKLPAQDLSTALENAGPNRSQLEAAIAGTPEGERDAMRWLIAHMPPEDLTQLSASFLIENHTIAYESWVNSPWKESIDEAIFLDSILPYACVNEGRVAWRAKLRELCLPLITEAQTPSHAAVLLNHSIWKKFGVKYSTEREKPDQNPFETMDSGLASCTGLSILLVDACRAVGIPARFVGTELWSDDSGNHSWIEVWDDGWHFTGAAEPTGTEMDKGWFSERASRAKRDDPKYAIYAASWRSTPISFPLVWMPENTSINAVNVTDRYTKDIIDSTQNSKESTDDCLVRLRVIDGSTGQRCAAQVMVTRANDEVVFQGKSKNEAFDTNDHIEADLRCGETYTAQAQFGQKQVGIEFQANDEGLQTLTLPGSATGSHITETHLTQSQAQEIQNELWSKHTQKIKSERASVFATHKLTLGNLELPFWYSTNGEKPSDGRSLYISMHGGGGTSKEVNDKQWENQKKLYSIEEGIYLAPRAATDTWNLWHQEHIDIFFDRLIQYLIVFEDVNPDKVYLTGYSAGGDGVFQLAPRMADRFAAAAMMAGHPNETKPTGLRNLPFALHMGGDDAAYDRNLVARQWQQQLDDLASADPGAYLHQVMIHEGKGHWMEKEDAVALPWMATHTRNLRPTRIVWLQDDVTHKRLYWLRNPRPEARQLLVVEREAQVITIIEAGPGTTLEIRLDDSMCDLNTDVVVRYKGVELFNGLVPRTTETINKTLSERGDPKGLFCGEIVVTVPEGK